MIKRVFISSVCFFSVSATAAPQFWGEIGPTVSFENPLTPNVKVNNIYPNTVKQVNYTEMVSSALPIRSIIKSGEFKRFRSELAKTVLQPICLVGDDESSLAWLKNNRLDLVKYQAVCFTMNAKTLGDLKRIKQASSGLVFQPVSGDEIAKQFNVPAYPALIYNGWVLQ